jgi:outer membrane protein OmpA-like peptidoglycan-associated protein
MNNKSLLGDGIQLGKQFILFSFVVLLLMLVIQTKSVLAATPVLPLMDGTALVSFVVSTVSASSISIIADGQSITTITVQLKDEYGKDLTRSGGVVTLTATSGTLSMVVDNNDGTYTALLTSAMTAGESLISGCLNGQPLKAECKVKFSSVEMVKDVETEVTLDSKSLSTSSRQAGLTLDVQFDFGKAKYSDSDQNGFNNATILGYGVDTGWDFKNGWCLRTSFTNQNSFDALSVYPGYELLDPTVTPGEKGVLTNTVLDGGVTYSFADISIFNSIAVGVGLLNYDFIAKEHGFLETRCYNGPELMAFLDKKLNDKLTVHGGIKFAPTLVVSDKVKGAWDDPDRQADERYSGSFWGTKWGIKIALNQKMWLETGFSYELLQGEGHEDPDYRFLKHDYTRYGFYALFGTRLNFGTQVAAVAQPTIQNPITPTSDVESPKILKPVIQIPIITITKVTPNMGFINTKANLTIEGMGFRAGIKVVFNKDQILLPVTDVVVISQAQISCSLDLKDAVTGTYDIAVTNEDGRTSGLSNAFIVKEQEQTISPIAVSPRKGFNNGSILISLKGPDILPGITVKLNNSAGSIVPGEIIKIQSGEAVGFFNLKEQSEGFYDFYLLYPDGHSKKVEENFEIMAFSQENHQSKTLTQVYFNVNQASISGDQIKNIREQLPLLLKNPNTKIILGGYTDVRGSYNYNLALSMRRAAAVKEILVAGGVQPEQISTYAYGKEQAKQGQNENVWQNDRRVDVMMYEDSNGTTTP